MSKAPPKAPVKATVKRDLYRLYTWHKAGEEVELTLPEYQVYLASGQVEPLSKTAKPPAKSGAK